MFRVGKVADIVKFSYQLVADAAEALGDGGSGVLIRESDIVRCERVMRSMVLRMAVSRVVGGDIGGLTVTVSWAW